MSSVSWTKEQQKVISLRGRNILVSAAAGSGKTAVLVERIITMLTMDQPPIDVDKLLIVTFTEAAAAEMRERIRDAIEKKLAEDSGSEHLRQQATLIHNAQITTIHSFCLSVIREHFHTIDIDPGFRIGEEGELKLIRQDVLRSVLEAYYDKGDHGFLDFTESYSGKRDDRNIEELVLRLYEFSRSYPDPSGWLASCIEAYQVSSEEELVNTAGFQIARENTRRYLESAEELIRQGIALCREPDGPYMYEDTLTADAQNVERFLEAKTYTQYYETAKETAWARLAANRDPAVSKEKSERVKAIREEIKAIVKDAAGQYFGRSAASVLSDIAIARPMMEVLASLTMDFARAFEEKKRARNIIDFSDMEQYALRILTEEKDGVRMPSKVAEEYQQQYQEVMIDEYQDSNLIQEAILTSVSGVSKGRYNIFMVGDVKQSIYRFRLSRPELFMEKFDAYYTDGEKEQRIDLHKNFRSRSEVLDSVNAIFEQIMTRALGGIVYDEQAALYVGADYEAVSGNETEVLLIDSAIEEDGKLPVREMEARQIARRIKKLMQTQQVTDKKTRELRPVRYSDIVILTRSLKGWSDVFASILSQEGIPVYTGTKEGYFETREIGVLLDYLRVLNNRQQDIPLAAVLTSYFGGFTDEELAVMKSAYPKQRFHRAVMQYASEGDEPDIRAKLNRCLKKMDDFRERVPYMAIHELLWSILSETGYDDYVAAMPGGEQRRANVTMLVEKAMAFESTSYKGLFNFVRYIELLQKYDVDYGEASLEDEQSDTVRIMSIHKSKGLEFPVVIAAGMGKRFNQQDARGNVLIHAGLGVGLEAVDLKERTKSPAFIKQVIQREEVLESLGEELRVLYVAFTRAREKLIITGILKEPEEKLAAYRYMQGKDAGAIPFGRLARVSVYWDWILPALARIGEDKAPIRIECLHAVDLAREELLEETADAFTREALENWDTKKVYDEDMRAVLKEQFLYQYPYEDMEGRKLKFTVSELKKREYLYEEPGVILYEEPEIIPLIPKFLSEQEALTGASRGSAYHLVMELLDLTKDYTEDSLKAAMDKMKDEEKLSAQMEACIKPEDILAFLKSGIGVRMREAAGKNLLFREQPFVLGVDMKEVYKDAKGSETILVQGIIDAYFEEPDALVVLDYKTDRIFKKEELVEKYQAQLKYYARALEQMTGKKVKEKVIYSFAMREEIQVEPPH